MSWSTIEEQDSQFIDDLQFLEDFEFAILAGQVLYGDSSESTDVEDAMESDPDYTVDSADEYEIATVSDIEHVASEEDELSDENDEQVDGEQDEEYIADEQSGSEDEVISLDNEVLSGFTDNPDNEEQAESLGGNLENIEEMEVDEENDELETDQLNATSVKKETNESNSDNKQNSDIEVGNDAGSQCIICSMPYTNSGDHRVCCLKCGHLFGLNCLTRWLKVGCHAGNRRCPNCNKSASLREIRVIYASNLVCVDTTEMDQLHKQLNSIQTEMNKMEAKLNTSQLNNDMQREKIKELESQLELFRTHQSNFNFLHNSTTEKESSFSSKIILKSAKQTHLLLSQQGGCRVLAYSSKLLLLIASQTSSNPLFPGCGIRKISCPTMRACNYTLVHKKPIRDMAYSPNEFSQLLTVSMDGTAKLVDVHNNVIIATFEGGIPLWSCCWSQTDSNKFYCGTQNGLVYTCDRRRPNEMVIALNNSRDKTGVISVCAVAPKAGRSLAKGGIVATKLNSVYTIPESATDNPGSQLPAEGNFMSMRYNAQNEHILLSTRPSLKSPTSQHMIYRLCQGSTTDRIWEHVHTFQGSRTASTVFSRSTFVHGSNNEELVAAHNTADQIVDVWDLSSTERIYRMTHSEPVLDICSIIADNEIIVPCLSDKKITVMSLKF